MFIFEDLVMTYSLTSYKLSVPIKFLQYIVTFSFNLVIFLFLSSHQNDFHTFLDNLCSRWCCYVPSMRHNQDNCGEKKGTRWLIGFHACPDLPRALIEISTLLLGDNLDGQNYRSGPIMIWFFNLDNIHNYCAERAFQKVQPMYQLCIIQKWSQRKKLDSWIYWCGHRWLQEWLSACKYCWKEMSFIFGSEVAISPTWVADFLLREQRLKLDLVIFF